MYITTYFTDFISVGLLYLSRIDEALRDLGRKSRSRLSSAAKPLHKLHPTVIICSLQSNNLLVSCLACFSALFSFSGRLSAPGSRSIRWWFQ